VGVGIGSFHFPSKSAIMCGRGRLVVQAAQIGAACGCDAEAVQAAEEGGGDEQGEGPKDFRRENFGPGMLAFIVIQDPASGKRDLRKAQWGLVSPRDMKNDGKIKSGSFFKRFNARKDRLEFNHKGRIGKKHCVVVFNGFYEWYTKTDRLPKSKTIKQPYYVHPKEKNALLCLAGLWEECVDPETQRKITTFSIITVDASKSFSSLHSRMPAVLKDKESVDRWLNATEWNESVENILQPDDETLTWHPVTPKMGKTSYQEEDCAKEIKLEKLTSIASLWGKKTKRPAEGEGKSSSSSAFDGESPSKRTKIEKEDKNDEVKETKIKTSTTSPAGTKTQPTLTSFFQK